MRKAMVEPCAGLYGNKEGGMFVKLKDQGMLSRRGTVDLRFKG